VLKLIEEEVKLVSESYIHIVDKWNSLSPGNITKSIITKRELNDYFHVKRKRMCMKLIILTEIAFMKTKISDSELYHLLEIGKYFEIKSTLIREFAKFNVYE
jgi:hypothetical protein